MTQNRKRGRNANEDETEFMPLSKRINNLHINNGMLMDSARALTGSEWGPGPPAYVPQAAGNPPLPDSPPDSVHSLDWASNPSNPNTYNPELTEAQNPHYFTINKLLYEMYLLRQQRTTN